MTLPRVDISVQNGNLGLQGQGEDGFSALIATGVAVGGQFALGDILGPFTSLEEVEAKGINEAYDTTNTCLAWKHCKDFYTGSGKGTKLYVMVVAKTLTMTDMCDKTLTHIKKFFTDAAQGIPKLLIVTRVPDAGYVPVYSGQLDGDVVTAITKAEELRVEQALLNRFARFIIEGRDFQGDVSNLLNLRATATSPNAPGVCVVIGNDYDAATAYTGLRAKYASAGYIGGIAAGRPVQRNIGRVKDGATKIITAGLSNGAKYTSLSDAQRDTLDSKGYIFFRVFEGLSGTYPNFDYTATVDTDDFGTLSNGRVIDKACRIAYQTYVLELNDDIYVDPVTGKMRPSVIKSLQGKIEQNINSLMQDEISGVAAFVDPDQNVLSTQKVVVELEITPVGVSKTINVKVGFNNPLNS